jgi:hypothetical protein
VRLFAKIAVAVFLSLPLMADKASFTLTEDHRTESVAIPADDLAAARPILEVEVTGLSNPALVPVGVAVFMVAGDRKTAVGNFAFFPADNKGKFLLNSRSAFAELGRTGNASLVFELRKLRPSAEWKPVRVTIAPPQWRTE